MAKPIKFRLTAVLLILLAGMLPTPVLADQGSAQNAISSAEGTMKNCYDAATQAEAAGADVTALVATLNSAAELLSKAKLAYASSNFDSAFDYASQSRNQLNDFFSQANVARENGISEGYRKQFTTFLSIGFSASILLAGVAVYLSLSRRERRKLDAPKASAV